MDKFTIYVALILLAGLVVMFGGLYGLSVRFDPPHVHDGGCPAPGASQAPIVLHWFI